MSGTGRANYTASVGQRCSSGKVGGCDLAIAGQLPASTGAPIYAQTSGYLKSWYFDIGAKVSGLESDGSSLEEKTIIHSGNSRGNFRMLELELVFADWLTPGNFIWNEEQRPAWSSHKTKLTRKLLRDM
jgi:hypothetical protein